MGVKPRLRDLSTLTQQFKWQSRGSSLVSGGPETTPLGRGSTMVAAQNQQQAAGDVPRGPVSMCGPQSTVRSAAVDPVAPSFALHCPVPAVCHCHGLGDVDPRFSGRLEVRPPGQARGHRRMAPGRIHINQEPSTTFAGQLCATAKQALEHIQGHWPCRL